MLQTSSASGLAPISACNLLSSKPSQLIISSLPSEVSILVAPTCGDSSRV
ncbi:hypothetical protein BC937DRAFT_91976 [Endogone sp. FLAS-F59071]|nr:hypothetical protein BC937DRAFT_91976 [Endogone sp. FLAS-F59071]|eukprot:RUS15806.1 hypothetical protein BC937DRAFT_91976 [Endogone sp. FLAS-F59071]